MIFGHPIGSEAVSVDGVHPTVTRSVHGDCRSTGDSHAVANSSAARAWRVTFTTFSCCVLLSYQAAQEDTFPRRTDVFEKCVTKKHNDDIELGATLILSFGVRGQGQSHTHMRSPT